MVEYVSEIVNIIEEVANIAEEKVVIAGGENTLTKYVSERVL